MRALVVEEPRPVHVLPGRIRLHVPGWSGADGQHIEAHLRQVPGVWGARANPLTRNVLIRFDPSVTDEAVLLAAIRRVGLYDALHERHASLTLPFSPRGRPDRLVRPGGAGMCHRVAPAGWSASYSRLDAMPAAGEVNPDHLLSDVVLFLARLVVRGGLVALLLDGIEVIRLIVALAEWVARRGRHEPISAVGPCGRLCHAYYG